MKGKPDSNPTEERARALNDILEKQRSEITSTQETVMKGFPNPRIIQKTAKVSAD